ncbi:hypothetical protein [Paraurantiacibacter namhicola]|uniref:Uncharacterized protein n=1 Tax=Paraurantiacibacter namhicola TaxID=645517 RepID=A0A1C7D6A8_9SPHN|nr:hypothetical protein [Paraurantiacibacter namhicola]ANU06997.1 hypothetical protein A6F65_00675 [Paraurantiacibacter namhicola]
MPKELQASDLPEPGDYAAVVEFAASFNGYERHGSFAACAEAAENSNRETLDELRNELFFAYRTCNHQGSGGLGEIYRKMLPDFERLLR